MTMFGGAWDKNALDASVLWWIKVISEHINTQEMYNEAKNMDANLLHYVFDQYKTQEMCKKEAHNKSNMLVKAKNFLKNRKFWNEEMHIR